MYVCCSYLFSVFLTVHTNLLSISFSTYFVFYVRSVCGLFLQLITFSPVLRRLLRSVYNDNIYLSGRLHVVPTLMSVVWL